MALILLLFMLILLVPVAGAATFPLPPFANDDYLFGVINDDGQHYDDEWIRGVRATTLELHWRLYEPQEGVYDKAYVKHMQQILAGLKSQGWYVQLVPGYHYVPEWVFDTYPDMRYVNQYGDAYSPEPGSFRVINAPFNPQAQNLVAGYLNQIFQDFNASDFDSVRVGGSVQGELRYPPPEWNGHSNSYWAFDKYAQDPNVSQIPPEVAGWRPGLDPNPGSVGRDQLIVNPAFEQQHPYFPIPAWSPEDEVEATLDETAPHGGSRALKVTIDSPHRVRQYVPVEPGTTYEFGAWLRSADDNGYARVFFSQIDDNHQPLDGAPFGRLQSNNGSWTYAESSLSTSADTAFLKVEVDGDRPGTFFFDDLWLKAAGADNNLNREITVPTGFYDWYVERLTAYQNWQTGQIRQYFNGRIDLIYPGKGLLPNQAIDALTNGLQGDGWSESSRALYSGTAYDRHVAGLNTTENVALYLTGIEEPAAGVVDDFLPYPSRWSAARWMAHLARSRGLPVWGENGGQNTLEELYLVAQRMHDNDFLGVMWAFESELYAGGDPGIDDYETVVRLYNDPRQHFLPVLQQP